MKGSSRQGRCARAGRDETPKTAATGRAGRDDAEGKQIRNRRSFGVVLTLGLLMTRRA
jgi:hypothetical protein